MPIQFSSPQSLFSQAIQVHFPQWDKGGVFCNLLGFMVYPGNMEKLNSFIVRNQLEQKAQSRKEVSTYSPSEYARDIEKITEIIGGVENMNSLLFSSQTNTTFNEFSNVIHRGLAVGFIFIEAVSQKISMQNAFNKFSKQSDQIEVEFLWNKKMYTYASFFNNVWREFAPVAHYWAAWAYFKFTADVCEQKIGSIADQQFFSVQRELDGKPNGLEGFFMVADGYLLRASTFVPPTSKNQKTLLEMKKCFYFRHPYYEI